MIPTFLQNFCVLLQRDDELGVRGTLFRHDLAHTFLITLSRVTVVIDEPLVLSHEVAHHHGRKNSKHHKARHEQPAVVHRRGMVDCS